MNTIKTGVELIAEERKEQIEKNGYNAAHDRNHSVAEFIENALVCANGGASGFRTLLIWPDFQEHVKGKSEIERLTIAGALFAAAIDKIQNS